MDELFWDGERGGYFNSRADDPTVIVRLKEDHDGAEPAPNSVAVMNLIRLDWMLGTVGARAKALATIEALRPQWTRLPQALPQMLCAVEMALAEPRTVVLTGDPASAGFREMRTVLTAKLGLKRAVLCADGAEGQVWLSARQTYLAALPPTPGRTTASVCENFTCKIPVDSPAALAAVLSD